MTISGSAQEVIGEWQDNVGRSWKHNIKILQEGDNLVRVSSFPAGRPLRSRRVEIAARPGERRRFRDPEANEIYAIDKNGNLDLYDSDGFIREAKKVR